MWLNKQICYTSFYCALLFCASQIVCFLSKWRFVASKSVSTIFPIAFAQFISLCQLLVVLAIFQTFSLFVLATYELFWRPMSCDLCYCCNVEGSTVDCTRIRWQSVDAGCVLTAPLTRQSLIFLPFLGPPFSLKHNNIAVGPINNSTVASKCSSKRKSYISLT